VTRKPSSAKRSQLEVVWSPLAPPRLREIRAYISLDNPTAAERLATRIIVLVEALKLQPRLGHRVGPSLHRELIISGTPYILFYRLRRKQILITTIHHSAQQK
jgi:toxin ParE1/3/4